MRGYTKLNVRFFLLFLIPILFLPAVPASTADLTDEIEFIRRRDLAEAYYLVGKQYISVGKEAKGNSYIRQAKIIYSQVTEPQHKPEPQKEGGVDTSPIRVEPETAPKPSIVKYRCSSVIRAVFREDIESVLNIVGENLFVSDTGKSYTARELSQILSNLFENQKLDRVPPQRVYRIREMQAEQIDESNWLVTVPLTGERPEEFSSLLPEYEAQAHTFYFSSIQGNWTLVSVGSLR
ncbi:MAG: hypothetical protein K9L68_00475 [Spirochaetales bacterium]|nr:hypothetical protein [Spirochaetales bacterium]MCF7937051.1 hypothetical protein [Spirochaetales bacterium]